MAENADLQYLSELLAQLADDMCLIRSDSAENRASWARFRNGVASLKGDVARLEEKLDPFHEATINRFDRLDDQMRSSSRHPIAEQLSRSEDENANDRNSRGREVVMYWNDHAPPHFHALLAEHRAVIEIDALTVVGGYLPRHKLRSVLKWAASRQDALHAAWRNTQALRPSGTIE